MKISEATFNELKETFDKAIQEAFGAGVKAEKERVIALHTEEPRTEKRHAKVGERILIVDASKQQLREPYKNGTVMTVTENISIVRGDVRCGVYGYIDKHEYEVIIEDDETPTIELQDNPTEEPVPIKSANQQRKELLQTAKVFWENQAPILVGGRWNCRPRFKVNHAKRTVTCELQGIQSGYIRKRATTRCHPNEVFNADIGKAISLCMAREIDIPEEFLNAVQPDEVVKGMKLLTKYGHHIELIGQNPKPLLSPEKIIDDTNAEYANET